MTPERWERITDIFADIREANPEDRRHLLSQVDEDLREDVARLLADDDQADQSGLMNTPLLQPGTLFAGLNEPRMFDPGRLLSNRFEILGLLGRGGMGEVYEAIDIRTGQQLAIKAVRHEYRHDEEVLRRFRTEPQRAALVNHPNVCRVFEALEDETPFFTMELLHGVPLEQHLSESGPTTSPEVALAICAGLEAVHRVGLVHRDLKTANVMLLGEPGRCAVLTDFGIAREAPVAGGAHTATGTGEFAGTLAYLAPELLEGCRANPASDIYALGVVLFRMVTGHYPFEATADLVSASMRIRRPAPSPRVHTPELPGCWETAIAACLEREPGRRPPTALTVARLLENSGTVRLSLRRRQVTHTLTRRGAIAAAATATAGLAGTAGWRWWNRPPFEGRKVRILVEDFTSSDPGGALGRAVRNIVRLRLGGTANVTVPGPDEVLKASEQLNLGTQSLRSGAAKALAQRLNVGTRVSGSVRNISGAYTIELRALAPDSDRQFVHAVATSGDQSSLIAATERACGILFAELTGGQAAAVGSLVTAHHVVTSSADAFEKLTSALFYQGFGSVEMALRLLGEATSIDPRFALAWIYKAVMLGSVLRDEEAFEAARKGYELRDRLNERQRLQAELYYQHFRGDLERALEMHKKLVAEFPTEASLHRSAAHAHSILGYTEDAIREARLALDLEPAVSSTYMILASNLAQAGRFQEALATLDTGRRGMPDSPLFYFEESSVRLLMGDEKASLAVLQRVENDSDREIRNIGKSRRLISQLIFGKLDEARVGLEQESVPNARTTYWLGLLYLLEGRKKDALREAAALSSRSAEPFHLTALRSAATLASGAGDIHLTTVVLEKARLLQERYPSTFTTALHRYVQGLWYQGSGNVKAAEKALSEARHLRPDVISTWALAYFFEKNGLPDRALPLYQNVVDNESLAIQWDQSIIWVRSLFHAGSCCEALGKTTQAAEFLKLYALHWGADKTQKGLL